MKKQSKLKLLVTKVSNLNEISNKILGGNTGDGAGKTKTTKNSFKVNCLSTHIDVC
ncbi:MAG: hypothetical protein AB8B65_05455 [Kordia sp.]|uniref:hypothetical protein n=1 Tax=Kordia sp. TaxID=1965332 RepID=UPI00385BC8D9